MDEDKIIVALVAKWLGESERGEGFDPHIRHAEFRGMLHHTLEAGLRNAEIRKRLKADNLAS